MLPSCALSELRRRPRSRAVIGGRAGATLGDEGRDTTGATGGVLRGLRSPRRTMPIAALTLGHANAESAAPALVSYRSVAASDLRQPQRRAISPS